MIIDSFTFFNELNMLEFRLEELNEYVDYFVLVEATKTFSGNPKPLYFQENKDRYSKFLHKIIHVVVDDLPDTFNKNMKPEEFLEVLGNPIWPDLNQINSLISTFPQNNEGGGSIEYWIREYLQRMQIQKGISQLNPVDTDIIIISDVDEILSVDYLQDLLNTSNQLCMANKTDKVYRIVHRCYYYNLECTYQHYSDKIIVCNYGKLKEVGNVNSIRWMNLENLGGNTIGPGGWHFSYFENISKIQEKIKSFSHQEYNKPEYVNKNFLKQRMDTCVDLFERDINETWYNYMPFNESDFWPKKINLLKKLYNL